MRGDARWDREVESEKECIWRVARRGGDREGNSGQNLEGAQYHMWKPGRAGVVELVREKEIEVTGRQVRGSMQGGAWGITGR